MIQQHHHPKTPPRLRLVCAVLTVLATTTVRADPPPPLPGPQCTPPVVPAEALDEARASVLREGLNQYKLCIQNYVDLHQAEAQRHQQAANGAVGDFNAFIRRNFPTKSDAPAAKP